MAKMRVIVPQKARGSFHQALVGNKDWIVDIKYDGERRIAQFVGGQVRFTGTPSKKTGEPIEKSEQVPHLSHRGRVSMHLPAGADVLKGLEGTILDGEIITRRLDLAGGRSKYVTSIMNSSPEEAIRKQMEEGWLHYVVFDCLAYKGKNVEDLPCSDRRALAFAAVAEWRNPYASCAKQIRSFEAALEAGEEGVIYKRRDQQYGDAKGWVKRKGLWTADVVIMCFKDAKEMSKKRRKSEDHRDLLGLEEEATMTKYAKAGLVGAVVVGQLAHPLKGRKGERVMYQEVATISGMDDTLRGKFSCNPKHFIDMVVRIKHNGREPTGRFRHPRWDDFREDKRAEDCVMWEEET